MMTKRWLLVLVLLVGGCDSASTVSPGADAATGSGGRAGNGSGGSTSAGRTSGLGGTSSAGGSVGSGGSTTTGGTTSSGGATGGAKGDAAAVTSPDARSDLAVGTGGGPGTGGTAGGSGGAGTGGTGGSGGVWADAGRGSAGDARPDVQPNVQPDAPRDSTSDPIIVPQPDARGDSGACPYTGRMTYTLAKSANPTSAEQAAYDLITTAMDKALVFYNCYTNITKALNVSYNSGVATADGNSNGSIRFGGTQYMEYTRAMHEISHTVGVGTVSQWSPRLVTPDGGGTRVWSGASATAELRAITGVATDVIKGDDQHFWPYGLNYASEWHSDADGINHCRMVVALRKDMGLQ